jgi:hypothetical protein
LAQPEHSLDEVTTFATGAGNAKKGGRPDDEVPETKMANKVFPSKLGFAIHVKGDRSIEFGIGDSSRLSLATEDIVGTDVNQLGSEFLSNHGNIAGSQGIHLEGFVPFILAVINSNIGGGIYDYVRLIFVESLLHRAYVADFDVSMGERDRFKISEDSAKVGAQLSIGACD